MNKLFAIVTLALTVSCASTDWHQRMTEQIRAQGKVLKHYKVPNSSDEIFIVQDRQNKIWKLRLFPQKAGDAMSGQFSGWFYQAVYSVDNNIGQCFAGPAQSPVECTKIKKDPDLGRYIK